MASTLAPIDVQNMMTELAKCHGQGRESIRNGQSLSEDLVGAVSINYQSPPYGIFQNLGHRYWTGPMTVTMSSSYATGGDTITLAQVGFGSQIDAMIVASMDTNVIERHDLLRVRAELGQFPDLHDSGVHGVRQSGEYGGPGGVWRRMPRR